MSDEKTWSIASWNVNGLRAVIRKGDFQAYLQEHAPDVLCLGETKLTGSDDAVGQLVLPDVFPEYAHRAYHVSSARRGYSGTAIWSRHAPRQFVRGLGSHGDDREGRVLTAEFDTFVLINVYTPNAGQALARLDYRVQVWDPSFRAFVREWHARKPVVLVGDLNCAHFDIDIHAPERNRLSAGFTDEERRSFSALLCGEDTEETDTDGGAETPSPMLHDAFRHMHPNTLHAYTYWSYRQRAREHNRGWRIDYTLVSPTLLPRVRAASIQAEQLGSDHCPVSVRLRV